MSVSSNQPQSKGQEAMELFTLAVEACRFLGAAKWDVVLKDVLEDEKARELTEFQRSCLKLLANKLSDISSQATVAMALWAGGPSVH